MQGPPHEGVRLPRSGSYLRAWLVVVLFSVPVMLVGIVALWVLHWTPVGVALWTAGLSNGVFLTGKLRKAIRRAK
jgi:hypothetical protein